MMDEKVKSPPPPVLSKKPSVPLKKTPTGGVPVAGKYCTVQPDNASL